MFFILLSVFLISCSKTDPTNFEEVVDSYAGKEYAEAEEGKGSELIQFMSATYRETGNEVAIVSVACTKKDGEYASTPLVSIMEKDSQGHWSFTREPSRLTSKEPLPNIIAGGRAEIDRIIKLSSDQLPKECPRL